VRPFKGLYSMTEKLLSDLSCEPTELSRVNFIYSLKSCLVQFWLFGKLRYCLKGCYLRRYRISLLQLTSIQLVICIKKWTSNHCGWYVWCEILLIAIYLMMFGIAAIDGLVIVFLRLRVEGFLPFSCQMFVELLLILMIILLLIRLYIVRCQKISENIQLEI